MCVIWRIVRVGRAIPPFSIAHVCREHVCQVGFVGSYRYQPKAQKFRTELRPALFALLRSKTGGREGQTGGFANLPVGSDPPSHLESINDHICEHVLPKAFVVWRAFDRSINVQSAIFPPEELEALLFCCILFDFTSCAKWIWMLGVVQTASISSQSTLLLSVNEHTLGMVLISSVVEKAQSTHLVERA